MPPPDGGLTRPLTPMKAPSMTQFPPLRRIALATTLMLGLMPSALANDIGGQQSYRLSDPSERLVKLNTLDLRERRRGGAFEFNTTNNIERQINCNFTVSATGNAASPTHAGAGIAPVGLQGSGLNASTTGNQSEADNSASGVNSTVSGGINPTRPSPDGIAIGGDFTVAATSSGGSFPLLGGGSANPTVTLGNPIQLDGNSQLNSGSHAANGTNVNQVGQSNTGSTLTSGIHNSPTSVAIGDISADGAQILNTVDTTQSLTDSDVTANVEGSRACDFVETNQTVGTTP